mgnify:FL=1|tara:strand:+ start:17573 stop:17803 length:231 start_codon:yes stop_codon:yes gene_type:complete
MIIITKSFNSCTQTFIYVNSFLIREYYPKYDQTYEKQIAYQKNYEIAKTIAKEKYIEEQERKKLHIKKTFAEICFG